MSKARNISNIFSGTTDAATDAEVTAAIASHNTSANGHIKRGGTSSRPGSPSIGDIYYNTDLKDLEQYTEDGWLIVAKQPPRIPTIGTATLQADGSVDISFTPSSYGQTASSYTVQSDPGSYTATGSSSPVSFPNTNIISGTSYTFRVKGTGSYGDSGYSGYTNSITALALPSYESIASYTGTSSDGGTVTFSDIPSTYSHLQIRAVMHPSVNNQAPYIRFNGDTGSNYNGHTLIGVGGASPSVQNQSYSSTSINIGGFWVGIQSGGGSPCSIVTDILDYTDTNKYKTIKSMSGVDNDSNLGSIGLGSGAWRNTSAITSITVYLSGTVNYTSGTKIALYGIKAA